MYLERRAVSIRLTFAVQAVCLHVLLQATFLRKNLNRLPRLPIHRPPPHRPTLRLNHLLDRPRLPLALDKPGQIIRNQMPILASGTLYDNDPLGIGAFGELVRAAMSALIDNACESDGKPLFNLAHRGGFACDRDRGAFVVGGRGGRRRCRGFGDERFDSCRVAVVERGCCAEGVLLKVTRWGE